MQKKSSTSFLSSSNSNTLPHEEYHDPPLFPVRNICQCKLVCSRFLCSRWKKVQIIISLSLSNWSRSPALRAPTGAGSGAAHGIPQRPLPSLGTSAQSTQTRSPGRDQYSGHAAPAETASSTTRLCGRLTTPSTDPARWISQNVQSANQRLVQLVSPDFVILTVDAVWTVQTILPQTCVHLTTQYPGVTTAVETQHHPLSSGRLCMLA